MTEQINLRAYERKAFTRRFEDGLWDIFIGCFAAQFAISPYLSAAGMGDFWPSLIFAIFLMVLMVVIWVLKRKVTTPRVGEMRVGAWRKNRLMIGTSALLVINIVAFILGLVGFVGFNKGSSFSTLIPPVAMAVVLLLLLSVVGFLFDVTRFYIYGTLLGLAALVGEWLYRNLGVRHHGLGVAFGVASGIIILTGVVLLIRFLRRYPEAGEHLDEQGAIHD